jgi:hypothetical protein
MNFEDNISDCVKKLKNLLLLKDESGYEYVSYYTCKKVAFSLAKENGAKFRLSSTLNLNDPEEGKTIFRFLDLDVKETELTKTKQLSFVGCFSFHPDHLNQYRLYGKEDNKEATGVCVVFERSFFNGNAPKGKGLDWCRKNDNDFGNLYRCVYIEPESKQVISIGHTEKDSFFSENLDGSETQWLKIKNRDEKLFKKVKVLFEQLKQQVSDMKNKTDEIIPELLRDIQFLIKHSAFKEEQECRLIYNQSINSNGFKMNESCDNLYMEYPREGYPINSHIKKIYFAPLATGIEAFKIIVGKGIECSPSKNLFNK